LGKTADPAIPELLGVVTNATDRTQGMLALEALYAIGSERAFDAVMSLKGTQPSFTEQRLRNNFVAHNPSMAEYARRRTESPDEKR
jgi:hypothetical protein